jgi:tRNA A37 threonylcarbamoyltransferase TsaD
MDVCFSGLYTAFKNRFENEKTGGVAGQNEGAASRMKHMAGSGKSRDGAAGKKDALVAPADLAFSLQEVAFDMVCEAAERALAHFEKDELVLAGGVACSKILQHKTKVMCDGRGARMLVPENKFLTDNGAMIAWEGFLRKDFFGDVEVNPQWRTDEV